MAQFHRSVQHPTSHTELALPRTTDVWLDEGGIGKLTSTWCRIRPFSGSEAVVTDLLAQDGETLKEGQVVVISTGTTAESIVFTPSTRLRLPTLRLSSIYSRASLMYSAAGIGHWSLLATGNAPPITLDAGGVSRAAFALPDPATYNDFDRIRVINYAEDPQTTEFRRTVLQGAADWLEIGTG